MNILSNYLSKVVGKVFRLLPMREDELNGVENNLDKCFQSTLRTLRGGLTEYPELLDNPHYICLINDIQFLLTEKPEMEEWKQVIFNTCNKLKSMVEEYSGVSNE